MKEAELKPCPFCGGEAGFYAETVHWINCKKCGAESAYYETPEEAIEAWNRRV